MLLQIQNVKYVSLHMVHFNYTQEQEKWNSYTINVTTCCYRQWSHTESCKGKKLKLNFCLVFFEQYSHFSFTMTLHRYTLYNYVFLEKVVRYSKVSLLSQLSFEIFYTQGLNIKLHPLREKRVFFLKSVLRFVPCSLYLCFQL